MLGAIFEGNFESEPVWRMKICPPALWSCAAARCGIKCGQLSLLSEAQQTQLDPPNLQEKNRRADVNTGMEAARGMTEVWEMKAAGERKKINTFKCVCESLLSLMYLQFIPHVQRLRIAARVCAVFSRQPVIKVVVMLYHRSEQISNFWKHARANKVCSVTLRSLTD